MKFLIVISLMAIIGIIMAEPVDEKPKLNMQQVEQLLEQIEKDEQRLSPKPNAAKNDETVTVALQQLFTQFRQVSQEFSKKNQKLISNFKIIIQQTKRRVIKFRA